MFFRRNSERTSSFLKRRNNFKVWLTDWIRRDKMQQSRSKNVGDSIGRVRKRDESKLSSCKMPTE